MLPHFLLMSSVLPLQTCLTPGPAVCTGPSAHGISGWGQWKKQNDEEQEDFYLSKIPQGPKRAMNTTGFMAWVISVML